MRRAALALLAVAWLVLLQAGPLRASTPFTARDQIAYDFRTSWSPDGRWIAYGNGEWNGLFLARPDGLEPPKRLFRMAYSRWSPHGERLLSGPYVVDPVSGHATRLEDSIWGRVDFSPDAARLAYSRYAGATRPLVVSAWDGTGRQVIADDSSEPEWSPTGEEIAFAHDTPCLAPGPIEVVRSDGAARRSFSSSGEWRVQPRWSPDGSLIAFLARTSCSVGGTPAHVYVVRPDGTGARILGDVVKDSDISWSPNGRWVAARDRISLRLTLLGAIGQPPVSFEGAGLFSWAPDGEHFAYSRDGVLYIGATDGSERRLATGFGADWSPDGSLLSYLASPYPNEMPFDHCLRQAFVVGSDGQGARALGPCWQQGDEGPNFLPGTSGEDFAEGFGGRDRIYGGAGNDILWGYGGVDRLYGGSGRDELYGWAGADRIGARDGERDLVSCGAGRDTVFADRIDTVSRDCERVRRR